MNSVAYTFLASPIGELLLVANQDGLREIRFETEKTRAPEPEWTHDPDRFSIVSLQLNEYFAGRRQTFEIDLAPDGTPFQLAVWNALLEIPYGTTVSYGDITRSVGRPLTAARAVGAANGSNPIPVVIPCHRVIGADGSLTGYGGGLEIKRRLLALEGQGVLF